MPALPEAERQMKLFWVKEGDLIAAYDQHDGFLRGIVMLEVKDHITWTAGIGCDNLRQGVSRTMREAKAHVRDACK